MRPIERFLDPANVSLKICGITREEDATDLVALGVDAMGVNFWPGSKRYLAPEAAGWLAGFSGRIARVGVFVNAPSALPLRLYRDGLIDLVQLHGDETPEDVAAFRDAGVPFIKAFGVRTADDSERAGDYGAAAVLLDAHAPGVYGGTGKVFDWAVAVDFKRNHPDLPLVLAGGIIPQNAADAANYVRPAALDIASGAEHSPGVKDMEKVRQLIGCLMPDTAPASPMPPPVNNDH